MLEIGLFYVAATISLISTVLAVTRYNAAHALIYLIISLHLIIKSLFFLLSRRRISLSLKAKMNITKSALALALASSARAFTPAAPSTRAFTSFARTSSNFIGAHRTMSLSSSASATALNAHVLKLTEPAKDLLPGVDVFIFDCDGVIWRVSFVLLAWANPLFYTFV